MLLSYYIIFYFQYNKLFHKISFCFNEGFSIPYLWGIFGISKRVGLFLILCEIIGLFWIFLLNLS